MQFPMRCEIFFGILLIFVNFVLSFFLKKFVPGQVKDFVTFSPNPSIIYTSKLTKLLHLQQITNKTSHILQTQNDYTSLSLKALD